jgi:MFS family permease
LGNGAHRTATRIATRIATRNAIRIANNRAGHMIAVLITARALRAFADGFVAVVLPAYLLALGLGQLEVGLLSTTTLLGSAAATLAVGRWGHRYALRRLLLSAAVLMAATGLGFAAFSSLWPLLLVAFFGPLNPSGGDVSVFQPLEHTVLAATSSGEDRTTVFARYSFTGSMFGALGALAAVVPEWLTEYAGWQLVDALRAMFVLYAAVGAVVWLLYRRLPQPHAEEAKPAVPLGPSRAIVWKLAALFSVDSFAGGLAVNALLALWLFERFGMSLGAAGAFFFWSGVFTAASQLVAPVLARRIGLINTMVFTHIPANLCLIGAAFAPTLEVALALLLARSALSQMDVPARSAFVMSVVTPPERPAAASFTAVPRSLASAIGPSLTGAMFAAGAMSAPLVLCGALKIAYDLALFVAFRRVKPVG